MRKLMNRRQMVGGTVGASAGLIFGNRLASGVVRANVKSINVLSMRPHLYHGWPTVTRRSNGELLVVCSGGREAHVCPFGWVEMMRSKDDGKTWSYPRVLLDFPIDVRDAGVLETAKGSVLVTTFTSAGCQERLTDAEKRKPGDPLAWSLEKLSRWRAAHQRLTAAQREIVLGSWMLRSTDGGVSWSAPYRCPVDSPHGPTQLSDKRLLYAGKILYGRGDGVGQIGACESTDDGQSWRWLAEIQSRPGDRFHDYHELYATETADGRILVQIRNHNRRNEKETLQSESFDGGRTWSVPRTIGVWGFPSHLLRLRDGRLLMSYGHRRRPLGVQARVSDDHGRTWSEAIILHNQGQSSDIGYPSTVQLNDGSLLTVWYELMNSFPGDLDHYNEHGRDEAWFKMTENLPPAVLRQARWSLDS